MRMRIVLLVALGLVIALLVTDLALAALGIGGTHEDLGTAAGNLVLLALCLGTLLHRSLRPPAAPEPHADADADADADAADANADAEDAPT